MGYHISYNTSLWYSKPDIVNSVIEKINNGIGEINEENYWTLLNPRKNNSSYHKWTSFKQYDSTMIYYNSYQSTLNFNPSSLFDPYDVMPITIYDI